MLYFGVDSDTSLDLDTEDVHIQHNMEFLFTEHFASTLTGGRERQKQKASHFYYLWSAAKP